MSLASVAIVGRPNVGKSSLLNALVGERISIVDPTPGVTRDRVVADVRHEGRCFHVIDTGGVGIVDRDDLEDHVEQQINAAVSGSDVVLFVVDIQEGLTKLDRDAVAFLRRSGKPVILVANKADHERFDHAAGEFARLGLGEPLLVAAKFNIGIDELRDAMVAHLPEKSPEEDLHNSDEMRLALVGQRNAGKSTLLNAILGEERVIVSPIAGTTRDAVDVRATFRGRTFVAIDTAGVRKANKVQDSIEFYSQVRSREAVERAQVVILLIDSTKEVSQVDKTVADWILTHRKPCVLAINKWDLAESITTDDYLRYLETRLPLLHYAPVVFLSARDRTRVDDLLTVAFDIWAQAGMRVGTPEVNRVLRQAVEKRSPRVTAGKLPKIFYGTQVGVYPPWFVFFTSDPKVIGDDYKRYLENRFREAFGFREIPLRVSFRERKSLGRVPGGGMGRDQDDMESVIPPLVGDDDGDLI